MEPKIIYSILEERETTHGDYKSQAALSRGLKDAVGTQLQYRLLPSIMQESIDMILHKISRICNGNPNHKDHWDDIAGYALLISKELEG